MSENFDVKLVENAKYCTPDAEYKRSSWIGDYQDAYRRYLADPDAFWEAIARELDWIRPWDRVCRVEVSPCPVVCQCTAQHHRQLP